MRDPSKHLKLDILPFRASSFSFRIKQDFISMTTIGYPTLLSQKNVGCPFIVTILNFVRKDGYSFIFQVKSKVIHIFQATLNLFINAIINLLFSWIRALGYTFRNINCFTKQNMMFDIIGVIFVYALIKRIRISAGIIRLNNDWFCYFFHFYFLHLN